MDIHISLEAWHIVLAAAILLTMVLHGWLEGL